MSPPSTAEPSVQQPQFQQLRSGRSAQLNAAAVVLWRSPEVLQLELGENRIVLDNVRPEQLAALLPRSDPSAPERRATPLTQQSQLAARLAAAGFLTGRAFEQASSPDGPVAAQLNPDLRALTGQHGDAAAEILARRRRATVAIHGTSRMAVPIANTLASAGVGWVQLMDRGEVSAGDSCPGGLTPADEGSRFGVAGVQAMLRHAPKVDTAAIPRGRFPDLVLLTDPVPVEPSIRSSLHLDGLAHLTATVDGSRAVIGPLVIPGRSSCLRCADLHRCDRDASWPALAVQLSARPLRRIGSETALCVATAGVAATQALAHLDRGQPATLNATLEWQLPDWRLRRRPWPVHHDCDCGAAARLIRR